MLISSIIGLTVSEILKFLTIYLEKVGQGRKRVSFAMVSFDGKYQNLSVVLCLFCASSRRFRNFNILNF